MSQFRNLLNGGFNPLKISGCCGYWEGSEYDETDQTIPDKSGYANHMALSQGSISASVIDGVLQVQEGNFKTKLISSESPNTYSMVAVFNRTQADRMLLAIDSYNQAARVYMWRSNLSNTIVSTSGDDNNIINEAQPSESKIAGYSYDGANGTLTIVNEGGQLLNKRSPLLRAVCSPFYIYIGAREDIKNNIKYSKSTFGLHSAMIFNRVLTDEEINYLLKGFQKKYNL